MNYVYVLLDSKNNFYSGSCSNLEKRFKEHQSGLVFATKSKLPVKLIYYEACINKYDACKREKYFKSGPGKKFLKNRLKNFFKASGQLEHWYEALV